MEKVLDDETRKLLEEISKMLETLNKEEMLEKLEKMKENNEDLEYQIDRNLELFRQLELEKLITEVLSDIEELNKVQEQGLKNIEEGKKDSAEMHMEDIENMFENVKEGLDEIELKNEELEESYMLPKTDDLEREIDNKLNETKEQMNRGRMKKAAESQEQVKEGLKNLHEQIFQFLQQMQTQQLGEDINLLRGLLENILDLSFDQEELMERLLLIDPDDPEYILIGKKQKGIVDEMKKVEDSLKALSKRQVSIGQTVQKELSAIEHNVKLAMEDIGERRAQAGAARQQYTITSLNNLSLLLAEALRNMENNMAMQNQMQGKGQCSQPGGGKSKSPSLSKLQQQLNEQLKKLQQQGNSEGKSEGEKGFSEELARMAAQQEMIRRAMEQFMEELEEHGINNHGLDKSLMEMEKTEEQLINKIINKETIERQKRILTRLLQSEKALQEREKDEKRESNEGKDIERGNQNLNFEYKEFERFNEMINKLTRDIEFDYFYEQKILQYKTKILVK